jgi:hypothetical protein
MLFRAAAAFPLVILSFFLALRAADSNHSGEEIMVDCKALMTDFPNCTDMMYTVCSDGTPSSCGAVTATMEEVSSNMTDMSGNMTGTEEEEEEQACYVFMCYANGTYVMHDMSEHDEGDHDHDTGSMSGGTSGASASKTMLALAAAMTTTGAAMLVGAVTELA